MSELVWSNEPPSQPGVYWMRLDTGFVGYIAQVLIVDGDMAVRWIGAEGFSYSAKLRNMRGSQWCGPLVPQQEVESLQKQLGEAQCDAAHYASTCEELRQRAEVAETAIAECLASDNPHDHARLFHEWRNEIGEARRLQRIAEMERDQMRAIVERVAGLDLSADVGHVRDIAGRTDAAWSSKGSKPLRGAVQQIIAAREVAAAAKAALEGGEKA